jgi:hypothetical protein
MRRFRGIGRHDPAFPQSVLSVGSYRDDGENELVALRTVSHSKMTSGPAFGSVA